MRDGAWFDIAVLATAIAVLAMIEWWGIRRWVQPHEPLSSNARLAMMLVILTMAGGFIGAFSWWADVQGGFAWDVPPLASRFLASAGWSFAFAAWMAVTLPTDRRLRLVLLMLFVYLAPLAVALLVLHLDRLDFAAPITYPFLAVVALLVVGPLIGLVRPPSVMPLSSVDEERASPLVRTWLVAVAAVTGAWSVALFAADTGPTSAIWVWPGDGLSSRLIGAMLLTISLAGLYAAPRRDTARIMTGVTLVYGIGLAVGSAWNAMAGKPVPVTYLLAFASIAAGSLLVLARDRATRTRPSVDAGAPTTTAG